MSPDSNALQWIALVLAVIQTIATLVQVSQKRSGEGGGSAALPREIKVGLAVIPTMVVFYMVTPAVDVSQGADSSFGQTLYAIFLVASGLWLGFIAGMNLAPLTRDSIESTRALANIAIITGCLVVALSRYLLIAENGGSMAGLAFVIGALDLAWLVQGYFKWKRILAAE
jgi:hypothetical protein